MKQTQRGFTLVELSIVLVILGLLIGGVLTGQSLIRAAELRSVTTQHARFVTATHTFRDKYFALPGDMTNAQSYWGVQDADPATCVNSASTDAKTCNGDGNGLLSYTGAPGSNEAFRFWQHLANAGLIEGRYSGAANATYISYATTANVPSGKISSSLWHTVSWLAQSGGANGMFDGAYGNTFQFGLPSSNGTPVISVFKPEELYNIDMKTDDGKPGTGKVVMRVSGSSIGTACTTGASSADLAAAYNLATTSLACVALFRQQF